MKEKPKYKWKSFVEPFYKGIDAQKVGEEIDQIGQNTKINSQSIVDYAREHTESELHKTMEWDDSIAAEKWRKHQASKILTHIVYVDTVDKTNNQVEIRVFNKNPDRSFSQTTTIVKNEESYQDLLKRAMMELQAFKKKYYMLKELEEILALI